MFRDAKSFRETTDGIENLPSCPIEHRPPNPPSSGLSRDPLHAIPDPTQTWTPGVDKEASHKVRVETTPTKPKGRAADALPHFRTPEKQGNGTFGKNRFGWSATESRNEMATCVGPSSRNGGSFNMTPRMTRATTVGRPSSHTETTPTKSVSKPPNPGFAPLSSSRVPGNYSRNGNYAALSRGVTVCNGQPMVINTVEVPHFDLKEDPSFWIHHNVQVIIRVRPLSTPERGQQGYNRCVKQESSQNITWIGQPETRFTFDHVACETVDQEMLFRKAGLPMVENCLSGYNSCMFAYGQTGSGKTYTMLGDLDDLEFKPSPHRGMTPRIFEYLFARIRAEEESRRDDQLKYSCKCSFLEIYNEQITDLLNPSSTNLLLREDTRKGIYVENLSEFEVYSVGDILNLLAQGSLNRKVAATNMNMESSRSHSVFTCVIESKWERDSTTNLRFARLNLVDLAGSERQKTSGAEGERLKEAANINKSLSTLGHVIMVLVDVANGKIRHVPYRDSKLTFLLQDSLGGNSKTIIIANISPSTGCAAETLNTLKFAQRAKLIQNNAIVNGDSSGDVSALQHQIRLLKEELSALKRQPVFRSLSFGQLSLQYNTEDNEDVDMEIDQPMSDDFAQFEAEAMKMSSEQLKSLEKMVAGALRREQMAETSIKKLEAEIEHLNRLVHQREEDARCSKMKLKFREDKIRRMDSLLKGVQPVDSYLLEENDALSEEIQMLQEKVDRNPEVTRFALENIRLLEQVKRFQDFYEEGERGILLSEVSELRDKLIQLLDENNKQDLHSNTPIAPKESAKSSKENDPVHAEEPTVEELLNLELELDILKIILKEERSSRAKADELATVLSRELELAEEGILSTSKQYEDVNEQLKEAKSTVEVLESQQLLSITELEDLTNKNRQYIELVRKQELELVAFKQRTCHPESDCSVLKVGKREETLFQFRLEKMQASLEKAKILNASYQRDRAFHKANEEEIDETRQQVEEETAQVILCLQEELSALQQQVHDNYWKEKEVESRLALLENTLSEQQDACNVLSCENEALRQQMKEKEKDVELLSKEWELLSSEIEGALTDGHEALIDASELLDSICSYVPMKGRWISEKVHRLIKQASEKELVIEELNSCLENANARLNDMECMLRSLKGAAMAITESHQKECSEKEKEIHKLRCELSVTSNSNLDMESEISLACDEMRKASKCATVAFVIVNRLLELNSGHLDALKHIKLQLKESIESNHMNDGLLDKCAAASEETERQIQSLREELELTEKSCKWLGDELAKQQAYIFVMERQLEEYHELDILKMKEKLNELQKGVSTMKLCMNSYEVVDGNAWLENAEGRKEYHVYDNSVGCPTDDESGSTFEACSETSIHEDVKQNEKSTKTCKGGIRKDSTASLLRKEIESALESLKEVQAEVIHLNAEKQELSMSERQSEGMGMVKAQVSHIQAAFGDFEDQCLHKMKALNQKLEQVEQHVEEATCSWCQAKEIFEDELSNATVDVAKKTAEASCLFSKYEEAQDVMKEADDMIKGLMIANETMKLEIKDLREQNIKSVQELEAFNILKGKLFVDIKRSFDCVTRKENEAEEFSAKLRTFESKITDLQRQEELMLERSNYLGFQLANLVKDMNHSNSDALASLLEKEKLLNDSKEATASQEENLMMELSAKDLELVIMTSELQQLADEKAEMETKQIACCMVLDHLKKEFVALSFSSNLMQQLLLEKDDEIIHLQKEISELQQLADEKAEMETKQIACCTVLDYLKEEFVTLSFFSNLMQQLLLEKDDEVIHLQMEVSELQQLANDRAEMETKQIACCTVLEHLKEEFVALSFSSNLMQQHLLEKDDEVIHLQKEVSELQQLANERAEMETKQIACCTVLEHLKEEFVALSFSSNLMQQLLLLEKDDEVIQLQKEVSEKCRLQERIHGLESKISILEQDLELRKEGLEELRYSLSSTNEESCLKNQELQNHVMKMNTMEEENVSLKNQLRILKLSKFGDLSLMSSSAAKCLNLTEAAEMESHRMFAMLNEKIEIVSGRLSQDNRENLEVVAKIEEMLEPLEKVVADIVSENSALQAELLRKDEVLNGLLFDLSLLQESASSNKDQKDEIQELTASLNFKENELETRSQELDDVVAHVHELEALMKEKTDKISLLERDLSTATNAVELLAKEKADLASHVDEILASKVSLERELNEKKKLVESLEIGIVDMQNSVDQTNACIESLKSELEEVSSDREQRDLEEKLDTSQALAEEYEAIAMEAKQIAESYRIYGEEKEEEVKLLERSVQELDHTVDAMGNKVDILKEEAERQRLRREELEIELDSLKHQMHNLKSADSDIKRHSEEKEQNLQKALKHVQKLEKDLADKDSEISYCKAHIIELNLHAEAQASEYTKKFKGLEAMVGQVKTEGPSSHGKSCSSNKLEKNAATKPRGSGSPFKCIGIGLAQQLKLEKDEDLTAERLRIQELEALAANRQKEIFLLNNRLAAAESMTHDVIRDLLGVKLDMANYVSMLDKQQVQKIAENAQLDNVDSEVKVDDINKLKKLLSEFVEERKGWLEEIDRRQAGILAAQLALEKLHRRDRLLTAENEVLKVDIEKYKNKIVELEGEVNKLSGQQNLHQRIPQHHAKIKEENNTLKRQNEEISARLQKAESLLMRMKEGLAGLRACNGKFKYIDFDEEKCLSNKLKEAEEERVQLAQELLGLCTSILKAAGIKKASSDINVASAEEALEQLRSRFTSLEREFENLKLKSRIENERIRLSEIIILSPRADDNCMTPPKRASQSPFFSALDR